MAEKVKYFGEVDVHEHPFSLGNIHYFADPDSGKLYYNIKDIAKILDYTDFKHMRKLSNEPIAVVHQSNCDRYGRLDEFVPKEHLSVFSSKEVRFHKKRRDIGLLLVKELTEFETLYAATLQNGAGDEKKKSKLSTLTFNVKATESAAEPPVEVSAEEKDKTPVKYDESVWKRPEVEKTEEDRAKEYYQPIAEVLMSESIEPEEIIAETDNPVVQRLMSAVQEMSRKVAYYDMCLNSSAVLSTSSIAADFAMTATTLNKYLEKYGVQSYDPIFKEWIIDPRYANSGYKANRVINLPSRLDEPKTKMITGWTQRGRQFIIGVMHSHGHMLSTERDVE